MTVTTVFAGTADDGIVSRAATYANARAGTSTTLFAVQSSASWNSDTSVIEVGQQNIGGSDFFCFQSFLSFDTSSIPDTDTVSAAALAVIEEATSYGPAEFTTADTLQARTFNWGASVTTADYQAGATFNGLTLLASLASGSWAANPTYNTLTENGTNFQTAVNVTGTTFVVLGTANFAGNTAPSVDTRSYWPILSANTTGTTQDPKLTVTHAAAASTTRLLASTGVGT